jgi:hypothetical protein
MEEKKKLSSGVLMAIGISIGVGFGIILAIKFDKPAIVVVTGYPVGLVIGILLKNKYGDGKKFGGNLSREQRKTQITMIVIISILILIELITVSMITH